MKKTQVNFLWGLILLSFATRLIRINEGPQKIENQSY